MSDTDDLHCFDSILTSCPNLISIKIKVRDDDDYGIYLLNTEMEGLSHIRYFETSSFYYHLELNLKYCETITSLLLISSNKFYSSKVGYSNFYNFISNFRKLTTIEIKYPSHNNYYQFFPPRKVDILQLLQAAPQLQKIRISNFDKIIGERIISSSTCLTSLNLEGKKMDVATLIRITTDLKQLKFLRLDIKKLIMNAPQVEFDGNKLFRDLISFTKSMPEFYICYGYKPENKKYIIQNGKNPYVEDIFISSSEDEDEDEDDDYDDNIDYDSDWFSSES